MRGTYDLPWTQIYMEDGVWMMRRAAGETATEFQTEYNGYRLHVEIGDAVRTLGSGDTVHGVIGSRMGRDALAGWGKFWEAAG